MAEPKPRKIVDTAPAPVVGYESHYKASPQTMHVAARLEGRYLYRVIVVVVPSTRHHVEARRIAAAWNLLRRRKNRTREARSLVGDGRDWKDEFQR